MQGILKVLIIRLSALGDVVHTLPAAAAIKSGLIRAGYPDTTLSWLVESPSKDLLLQNDLIDEVILFPKKALTAKLSDPSKWFTTGSGFTKFTDQLKGRRFDAVIDFQGLLKSSILGYISGAKFRIGYSKVKEFSHVFLTHKLEIQDYFAEGTHIVNRHLLLADFTVRVLAGKLKSHEDFASVAQLTSKVLAGGATAADTPQLKADFSLPRPEAQAYSRIKEMIPFLSNSEPKVVLIPGTTWDTKIWSPKKWAELGSRLAKSDGTNPGAGIIVAGGPGEEKVNSQITASIKTNGPPPVDLTGKTSLVDLIALYENSDLVIGGDTGPMHLACATGHPRVLALYGATPKRRNGPYGGKNQALALDLSCQPCDSTKCPLGTTACLVDMSVDLVYEQAKALLG